VNRRAVWTPTGAATCCLDRYGTQIPWSIFNARSQTDGTGRWAEHRPLRGPSATVLEKAFETMNEVYDNLVHMRNHA